ncbi:hypothetical protein [Methylobacterium sp. R2-1]|uniref:hypothetical protein n=1 Tax=Methylobacterium sp. R2-1 TaxID=2587064 RepID=UPI00160FA15D|nr:hypothetical protein [Methylobacterium sp. R2-1]MBB2961187.1 hypothetical protein [Methylobacterium sp. R2-1]
MLARLRHGSEHPLPHLSHAVVITDAGLGSLFPDGLINLPHGPLVQAETAGETEQAAHLGGGSIERAGTRTKRALFGRFSADP